MKGLWTISVIELLVKLHGKPLDMNIMQALQPASDWTEEDINTFYNELHIALDQFVSFEITMTFGNLVQKLAMKKSDYW